MTKLAFYLFLLAFFSFKSYSQCTTSDATSCLCEDGSDTCDLLPDITISWYALESYLSGPNEYSQTGNGINNGRLKFTASTPNIGFGPLTVRGSDFFVCGNDTVLGDPGVCPDGTTPKQLITQRVYRKEGNVMTHYDIWAGAMTYHPTHNHNHVDDWGVFTLRLEDPNEPNPLNWPIIGDGAKLGFCLMDYGTCSNYNAHCKDTNTIYLQGTTLTNTDFPNYGLGGGSYNCSVVEQGISSGYTDIYSENLDGMWITIPPGTCNGDYWIVAEVDPVNSFIESDETNNWTAIPITLTLQDPPGNPHFEITSDATSMLCSGQPVTLKAPGGLDYHWSTGDSTQTITVNTPGNYTVSLTNHCGSDTSDVFVLSYLPMPAAPTITCDSTICEGQSAILTATGSNILWYDNNGFQVGAGNSFTTPSLLTDRTYTATSSNVSSGTVTYAGIEDTTGVSGGYFNGTQSMVFDTYESLTLKSVLVFANGDGNRTIQLQDDSGSLLQSKTAFVPDGESRVDLDFDIPVGTNYRLTVLANSNLYRSSNGVNYPYTLIDTISIHSSSAGSQFYYYFYDWEIEVGSFMCEGPAASQNVYVYNCLGIDDVNLEQNISLYPNPSQNTLNFEFFVPGTASFEYRIIDVLGKNLYSESITSATGLFKSVVDVSGMPPATYVMLISINGQTISKSFVVTK